MNHNRKRREAEARERRRREANRRREEAAEREGIAIDPSALAPNGGYDPPDFIRRGFYMDVPFTCASCGSDEVWTASRQKWWYEVVKGSVHSTARLCRECRRRAREEEDEVPSYERWHRRYMLFREDLDSILVAAGWRRFRHRRLGLAFLNPNSSFPADYERGDALLSLGWLRERDATYLIVELLDGPDVEARTIARIDGPGLAEDELERQFAAAAEALRDELTRKPAC